MIVVSGTRRSGTSMWMQALAAAGLPVIGERFPLDWESALGSVNRHGFFESSLRDGINFVTNPDPRSGEYLHPAQTRYHAVKVFAEGLVRSDLSFLDRVLVTLRPWREVAASFDRLIAIENTARGVDNASRPPRLSGALEWWNANYAIVRDVAVRRYAIHIQSYHGVLRDPAQVIPRVLAWISELSTEPLDLDERAAIATIDATARTIAPTPAIPGDCGGLDPDIAAVFDAYEEAIARGDALEATLLARMNDAHAELLPQYVAHGERLSAWLGEHANLAIVEPLSLRVPAP